jgi:predicted acyltransferase
LHRWLYEEIFAPVAGPLNGSLLFALAVVLFWMGILWALYRRRVFIRI